jgi:hypothetical protein
MQRAKQQVIMTVNDTGQQGTTLGVNQPGLRATPSVSGPGRADKNDSLASNGDRFGARVGWVAGQSASVGND